MTNERNNEDADTPVGDMTEEGQIDLGPIPELGNIENLAQADLEAAANLDEPPSGR